MPSKNNLHKLFTADELVTRGLKLYKQSKYEEALESLNAAEEAKNGGADLEILDIRAGTHIRMKNHDAALADARRMLVLDKTYVPGYLRTGRILELMDKSELALKIYERGICYGSQGHARYTSLKTLHADLKQQIAPAAGVNLFNVLPVELLEMIWHYLPFNQVCRCLRVCQQWRQILTSWPRFWIHMDFSAARREVKNTTLLRYVAYAKGDVRIAILNKVVLQANPILSKFAGKCRNLQSLSVLSGGALQDSLASALIRLNKLRSLILGNRVLVTTSTMIRCLESCPSLGEITCHALEMSIPLTLPTWGPSSPYMNLQSWSIEVKAPSSRVTLPQICPPAPSLHTLKIRFSKAGGPCSLDSSTSTDIAQRYPNLQHLELQDTLYSLSDVTGMVSNVLLPLQLRVLMANETGLATTFGRLAEVQNLVHLQLLHLRESGHGTDLEKVKFILACDPERSVVSRLHTLKLSGLLWDTPLFSELLSHPRLNDLQHLGLIDARGINDRIAAVIADIGKGLRTLLIPNSRITGAGLKELVLSCPNLGTIDLNGCTDVSVDAIDWAREQGVSVTWKLGA